MPNPINPLCLNRVLEGTCMRYMNQFLVLFISLFWLGAGAVLAAEGAPLPELPGYQVGISDELNFRFIYVPELNTVVTVRSDGRISLPLIGELLVDGLTLAEVTERVEAQMSAHLRRPQLVVNVQGAGSRRVFVGGEVGRPSMQPLLGPLTVLQAVMVAEGLRETASPQQTTVLRRGPAGERTVLSVDLDAVMSGRDLTQDLPLQAYDVVIVPRSGIANLGRWVDQYIRRVVPVNLGFNYTINRNGVLQ
jgi:protein involved in polysaccharide export with SLBB domain